MSSVETPDGHFPGYSQESSQETPGASEGEWVEGQLLCRNLCFTWVGDSPSTTWT